MLKVTDENSWIWIHTKMSQIRNTLLSLLALLSLWVLLKRTGGDELCHYYLLPPEALSIVLLCCA
jgi:hypothetical protein